MTLLAATVNDTASPAGLGGRGRLRLKHEPLAAHTILQLLGHLMPAGSIVDLHVRYPGGKYWPKRPELQQIPLAEVGSQCFEMTCAGGDAWEGLAINGWNGTGNIVAFDIDGPVEGRENRGCNHPTVDGGAAEAELAHIWWEATGGDMIKATSITGTGHWLLGVQPADANGAALAQYVLREMQARGFKVGNGMLEAPMAVARLPLAGYQLEGHEELPWIEQVGELVSWIDEQLEIVRLRAVLPVLADPEVEPAAGPVAVQQRPLELDGIKWTPEARSNGFLAAVAKRAVRCGYGIADWRQVRDQVLLSSEWIGNASAESMADLRGNWAERQLKAALRNAGVADPDVGPAGLSNEAKHRDWCDRLRAGVAAVVRNGVVGITRVIGELKRLGMSGTLLWERVELVRQGIAQEVALLTSTAENAVVTADLSVTPTQSIPMGVKAVGSGLEAEPAAVAQGDGLLCRAVGSESIKSLDPVPPVAIGEPGSCGANVEERSRFAVPAAFAAQVYEHLARFRRDLLDQREAAAAERERSRLKPGISPPPVKAVAQSPLKPGLDSPLKPGDELRDQRRSREQSELLAWLSA